MEHGTIKKADAGELIAVIGGKYIVYGPLKDDEGVSLSKVGDGEDITFEYSNFNLSPKGLFFPQSEVIYTYDDSVESKESLPEEKFIVFGMRPCDASALLRLDEVYKNSSPEDPYYIRRRENAVIVSLACKKPCQTCFCTSVGEGPAAKAGADVIAFDLDDSLFFEACTKKGKKLLDLWSELLQEPDSAALESKERQKASASGKVYALDSEGVTEKLRKKFESPIWKEISQRCLSCGACTFFCPTCHCFGINDEPYGSENRRVRCWDTCMFKEFGGEASGHNPRGLIEQRLRQRIMHKFLYTAENFGDVFCVGCGRCINRCPVNIDIREIITEGTQ